MTVYVVTYQESYEDLHIVKIFSTYELASAYIKQFNVSDRAYYDIGEFEVDE